MTDRSSIADIEARVAGETVPTRFMELVAAVPASPSLHAMGADGGWHTWTLADLRDRVAAAAAGLLAAGVEQGDRVLLMMRNRPDFHWLDLAAQFVRAVPVSIYNSSSAEELRFLAGHAGAPIIIVEDAGFLDRLTKVRGDLPALRQVYVIEPRDGPLPDGVAPAADLYGHGAADLDALAAATDPGDLATLIYTSGTTGPPKGVMLNQFNVVYTIESLRECIRFDTFVGKRVVSYLPMAHIAERMMSHYMTAMLGFSVYCCPDASQLASYLTEVRPQMMFGVPRVYEKIYHGVNAVVGADAERKAQFDDGIAAAIEINRARLAGTVTQEQLDTWSFLDAVAFSTVRSLVGLDALESAVTGAAPILPTVVEWFNAIGVPLSEIYGMSESSGPMTWSPERSKPGSVGRPIPGCEVRIADDGEVLCRGGNVFQGYLGQPETTAETIVDGWLHSGDIGEFDDEGYLSIVDRKKELIITSGGKNISPANLEAALKMIPLIGQAAAIGDKRKFCTALLVLDPDEAGLWAKANGKEDLSLQQLAADPDLRAAVQTDLDEINEQFAPVERIKKFALIGEEWLPDSDVLTPTSKLKRRGVAARYADVIDAMYGEGD